MRQFTRRELMKCLAAGGAVVAGELWVPGARKIFLPPESGWPRMAEGTVGTRALHWLDHSIVTQSGPAYFWIYDELSGDALAHGQWPDGPVEGAAEIKLEPGGVMRVILS